MNKKLMTAVLALIMIISCLSVVYAEKDNKSEQENITEAVETEGNDDPEPAKTTAQNTTAKEDDPEPTKATAEETTEKTTEKPTKVTNTTKETTKTTVKESTKAASSSTSAKTTVKTTVRETIAVTKPTATLRKSDSNQDGENSDSQQIAPNEVVDYTAQDEDKYLDFRNEPNVTGEVGYFGPEFSDGAGSMSQSTGLVINATDDGVIGIDFSDNELKSYKYAFIKVKTSNKDKPVKITMKIGNVTLPLDEWVLSNGSKFPENLSTDYKTYALDLRANGVTELITHSTDASEAIEDMQEDYDIRFTANGVDGADVIIESIIFTDDKPVYKTSTSTKKSLIKRIAFPLILIAIAVVTLFIVNFIIYKRNQHNENMVTRSKKNSGGYRKRS